MGETEVVHKELSFRVMGAAFEVHNTLGVGFRESIYEQALAYELAERSIPFDRQVSVTVKYKGKPLGLYRLDFVVDRKIALELKVCSEITKAQKVQAYNYLAASGLRLAILLNFGPPSLESARIVTRR